MRWMSNKNGSAFFNFLSIPNLIYDRKLFWRSIIVLENTKNFNQRNNLQGF